MGQGPGLLRAIFHQIWTFLKGVGHRMAGLRSYNAVLLDWLADLMGGDIFFTEMKVFQRNDNYVYCKIHFSSFVVLVCQ